MHNTASEFRIRYHESATSAKYPRFVITVLAVAFPQCSKKKNLYISSQSHPKVQQIMKLYMSNAEITLVSPHILHPTRVVFG